jgi:hypothetical protein
LYEKMTISRQQVNRAWGQFYKSISAVVYEQGVVRVTIVPTDKY